MKKIVTIAVRHPEQSNLFLHGLRRDNHKWALAGGHAKPGEDTEEAAHRELEEETGLKGVKLEKIHENTYGETNVHLFATDYPKGFVPNANEDPDNEFAIFKFLDPTNHENLHIPKERNILSEWMTHSMKKPEPMAKMSPKIKVEPFIADPESFNPKRHDFIVNAFSKGKKVGMLAVTHTPQGLMPFNFEVNRLHRRKGIGTAMAAHAQKISGKKIHRSPDMTQEAVEWANKFIKSEDLGKGAMRRLAPYNPNSVPSKERDKAHSWMANSYRNSRDQLTDLGQVSPNAKVRALHQLSGKTSVRVNPQSGEREFLLHRGAGKVESALYHKSGQVPFMTSWTPRKSLATSFAHDNETIHDDETVQSHARQFGVEPAAHSHLVSAWIPESQIHHAPRMIEPRQDDEGYADPDETHSGEHELIVKPHPLKDMSLVQSPEHPMQGTDVHSMINLRGESPGYRPHQGDHPLVDRWKKSLRSRLGKAEAEQPQDVVLSYPVTIGDRAVGDDGNPFFIMVKNFGPIQDPEHADLNEIVDQHQLAVPLNPAKMMFVLHKLKALSGEKHVLAVHGMPQKLEHLQAATSSIGPQSSTSEPYIAIDEGTYHRLSQLPAALTADDIGIKIHPAELKQGGLVLRTY